MNFFKKHENRIWQLRIEFTYHYHTAEVVKKGFEMISEDLLKYPVNINLCTLCTFSKMKNTNFSNIFAFWRKKKEILKAVKVSLFRPCAKNGYLEFHEFVFCGVMQIMTTACMFTIKDTFS